MRRERHQNPGTVQCRSRRALGCRDGLFSRSLAATRVSQSTNLGILALVPMGSLLAEEAIPRSSHTSTSYVCISAELPSVAGRALAFADRSAICRLGPPERASHSDQDSLLIADAARRNTDKGYPGATGFFPVRLRPRVPDLSFRHGNKIHDRNGPRRSAKACAPT